ncbi:PREDICTED: ADM2 [Poecilia mexicana]|uniref:Adrenomedullin 2 n=1 Tax=Poecilia formosa TaxID=48698 RepID=A0A096MBD2_POEFO|nr:PREDICTED: ADM2 isoform X1 [Poecilia formosa]XP_014838194.1 PREDICTED: ADM2 [Poecilia mexicana]
MRGLPLVWLCLLLSLLPLEIQSRGLRVHRHRLGEPRINKASYPNSPPGVSDLSAASSNQTPQEDTQHTGRAPLHRDPSSKLSDMLLRGNSNALPVEQVWQRGSRGRRHANSGSSRGHGHLMRVGCVLGTCQVQNLSHRLYQLIGQNGREDFSPINPRSPHSYG